MKQGFTLAELLIALAVLGVIATFAIPKILDSSSTAKYNSVAKEVAAIISNAYSNYKLNNTASASTSAGALTPYINYVKQDTATNMSAASAAPTNEQALAQVFTDNPCAGATVDKCLLLHSGAHLVYEDSSPVENSFGGTTSTHALIFGVDPDGPNSGAGAVIFVLYYNGRLTTLENAQANGLASSYDVLDITTAVTDPAWLSWN